MPEGEGPEETDRESKRNWASKKGGKLGLQGGRETGPVIMRSGDSGCWRGRRGGPVGTGCFGRLRLIIIKVRVAPYIRVIIRSICRFPMEPIEAHN